VGGVLGDGEAGSGAGVGMGWGARGMLPSEGGVKGGEDGWGVGGLGGMGGVGLSVMKNGQLISEENLFYNSIYEEMGATSAKKMARMVAGTAKADGGDEHVGSDDGGVAFDGWRWILGLLSN